MLGYPFLFLHDTDTFFELVSFFLWRWICFILGVILCWRIVGCCYVVLGVPPMYVFYNVSIIIQVFFHALLLSVPY